MDGRGAAPRESEGERGATPAGAETGRLVAVCGLPGVGKTRVAQRITDRLDGRLIRTDVVRKELFSDPEYTAEERRRVYDELFARGREAVESGTDAVLDATFRKRDDRRRAAAVAEAADAPFEVVLVECDERVVRERIAAREGDESDADFDVYLQFRDRFESVERDHETVDNSGGVERTHRRVDELF